MTCRRKSCVCFSTFISVFFLFLFSLLNTGFIDPLADRAVKGNKLYWQKKYVDAQKEYQSAQRIAPDSPELFFNVANALYKQGKYDEAEVLYNKALGEGNNNLKARAHYNLGNVKVKKKQLEDALKSYRNAIKLNPDDKDARINYEHVLRMQQQQQQQQQQDQQKDKEQDKDKQDDKEKNQDQQQNQQDQKKDQEKQEDSSDQNQQKQDQQQQDQQKSQPQGDQPQKQPLTPEQQKELKEKLKPDEKIEANPYLQALEKQEFEKRRQKKYGDSKLYIENDW